MASEKTTYWMAVGVLTLGLANAWQNGDLQPVRNLAERGKAVVECAANRGHDLLVMSEVLLGRDPAQVPDVEALLAPEKHKMVWSEESAEAAEQQVADAQARLHQVQSQLAQVRVPLEKTRAAFVTHVSVCPEERLRAEMGKLQSAQDALANLPQAVQADVRTADFEALQQLQQLRTLRTLHPEVIVRRNDFSNWAPEIRELRHRRHAGKHEEPI